MSGSTTRDSSTPPAHRGLRLGLAEERVQQATEPAKKKTASGFAASEPAWWPGGLVAAPRSMSMPSRLPTVGISSSPLTSKISARRPLRSTRRSTVWCRWCRLRRPRRSGIEVHSNRSRSIPSMTNACASASAMSLSCCASEAGSTPCCSTSTTAPSPPPSRLRGREASRACAVEAGRAASHDLRRTAVTVQRAAQDRAGVCRVQLTRGHYLRRMRANSRWRVSCVRRGSCDTFRFSRSRSSPSSPRAARTRATRRRVEASSIA